MAYWLWCACVDILTVEPHIVSVPSSLFPLMVVRVKTSIQPASIQRAIAGATALLLLPMEKKLILPMVKERWVSNTTILGPDGNN